MSKKEYKILLATAESLKNRLIEQEDFLNSLNVNQLTEDILHEIEFRLQCAKDLNNQYDELYIQLTTNSISDEPLPIMSTTEFFKKFVAVNVKSQSLLKNKSYLNDSYDPFQNNTAIHAQNINARLQKLSVPTFDGDYTNFTSYKELFTALIHNNPSLTDVERFMYLKDSLKGSAAQLISNIQPTGQNYKIAFDLICERFDNPKLIIHNHIKAIFELKSLTKDNSTELRHLYDELNKHLRALDNMQVPLDYKAIFIAHLLTSKFDPNTRREFSKVKPKEILTLKEIDNFLKERCQYLEEIDTNKMLTTSNLERNANDKAKFNNYHKPKQQFKQTFLVTNKLLCPLCKGSHSLNYCSKFLELNANKRIEKAKELSICTNCLYHSNKHSCNSRYTCQICKRKHHTLLHLGQNNQTSCNVPEVSTPSTSRAEGNPVDNVPNTLTCLENNLSQVILPTAIVLIRDKGKKWHRARVLLDSGSHVNLLTDEMANKLQVPKQETITRIRGINSNFSQSNSIVNIEVSSTYNNYRTELSCMTIQNITNHLPLRSFKTSGLSVPTDIRLADDKFNISSSIDLLIGASLFYSLLCVGQISLGKSNLVLQKTLFGWVVSGGYDNPIRSKALPCTNLITNNNSDEDKLEDLVKRFWQIETIEPSNQHSKLSENEKFCEQHFYETVRQDPNGRIIVSIPFNSKLSQLGYSKQRALECFSHLETRLLKNPDLHIEYSKFMKEYIDLDHMQEINNDDINPEPNCKTEIKTFDSCVNLTQVPEYFFPHHSIIKSSSLTTKIRIVFNGSSKTTTGVSFNDTQIPGPTIQRDIFSILLHFRQHLIALTGDVEKMYRQILIDPKVRKFHQILWRPNNTLPLKTYQLKTITYGTTSASYLATKCLHYLADLHSSEFPLASEIIKNSFYMDDLITGADYIDDVLKIKSDIIHILGTAGLPIRKFLSNDSRLLSEDTILNPYFTVPLCERNSVKTLGISWNSLDDEIHYSSVINGDPSKITKRVILSTVAKLFDPLGLLSPIVVKGKLIIQRLWQLGLSWDESIPSDLTSEWIQFKNELSDVKLLKFPRCIKLANAINVQLHGFSDSSTRAYGACVYIRSLDDANNISVRLLCSKTKLCPLQGSTIPRLELCAAVLLAQLVQKIRESLSLQFNDIFLWTDSTIVKHWINSTPNKYKTYVANRIAFIHELTNKSDWYHVRSSDNPADLLSRGASVSDLLNHSNWCSGPNFLLLSYDQWPQQTISVSNLPTVENKILDQHCLNLLNTNCNDIFKKFSKFNRLIRVVSWIMRFKNNARASKAKRILSPLKSSELSDATKILIRLCQFDVFSKELKILKSNKSLKAPSNILRLNPFLDDDIIIRVGGRIKNSDYNLDKRFPVLLPKNHTFTKLIATYFHESLLHCGAQALVSNMREQYWLISGISLAKVVVHKCVICFKASPSSYNPLLICSDNAKKFCWCTQSVARIF